MLVQVAFVGERPAAQTADEVLVNGVQVGVRAHVRLVVEGSPAAGMLAPVGFLPRVDPQVTLEQPRSREGLVAERATILRLGVTMDVTGEGVDRRERLAADEAPIELRSAGDCRHLVAKVQPILSFSDRFFHGAAARRRLVRRISAFGGQRDFGRPSG